MTWRPSLHLALVWVFALCAVTGCSSTPPVQAWQQEIEHYVARHGHGNPAALADLAADPTHPTFDHVGDRTGLLFPRRTDARGLLVGHRFIDDELWFVYLVGTVQDQGGIVDVNFDRPVLQAIHPVAFAVPVEAAEPRDGFRWAVGEADEDARAQYLTQQRERWARGHGQRALDEMQHTSFPRSYDRFVLAGDDRALLIRHPATGASWSLELPPPPARE